MNKAIRVLSIMSVVIANISILFAFLFLTFFWEEACVLLYYDSQSIIDIGPQIPIGDTIYLIGCLIFAFILFKTTKSNKNLIVEILVIVCLGIVLPMISWWLGIVQNHYAVSLQINQYTSLMVTKNLFAFAISIMRLSVGLSLVISGMRISEKLINRKNNQSVQNKDVSDVDKQNNKFEEYEICILDVETKILKKEMRKIDVEKFPVSKYSFNNTYYAIEKNSDGKKVRVYYTKDAWDKYIKSSL